MNTFTKAFGWGFGLSLGAACASLIIAIPAFLLVGGLVAAGMSGA